MIDRPKTPAGLAPASSWRQINGPLFRKYVAILLAVVCVVLLINALLEAGFAYQEHKASLIRIQREQAEAAAAKIGQFIKEIESQVGWTTQLPWSAGTTDQRKFDGLRLLRQVPAITELAQLDSTGKEQLRVSRLAMDVVGSQTDFSQEPKFADTVTKKVYYGPVYFRRESEPYMTLALAGTRRDAGVSVAEVNLKLIWDVVSQIKVGDHGQAYVVDAEGRLIAHPDISLVLRNTDMTRLAQVKAARAASAGTPSEPVQISKDVRGRDVLTAYAPVAPLGWLVFAELPVDEAYAPLYQSLVRSGALLLGGLALAFLAGLFLARRMVVPIQALRRGAARIGSGDLTQRISIRTGDELEALADQFNDMAEQLQDSYADLESKVEERTHQLALANLAKSRFLASASHDLRQPLHALGLFVAQLRGHMKSAEGGRLVERIDAAITAITSCSMRCSTYPSSMLACLRSTSRTFRSRTCSTGSRARSGKRRTRTDCRSSWCRAAPGCAATRSCWSESSSISYPMRFATPLPAASSWVAGGAAIGSTSKSGIAGREFPKTSGAISSANSTASLEAIPKAVSASALPSWTACAPCSAIPSNWSRPWARVRDFPSWCPWLPPGGKSRSRGRRRLQSMRQEANLCSRSMTMRLRSTAWAACCAIGAAVSWLQRRRTKPWRTSRPRNVLISLSATTTSRTGDPVFRPLLIVVKLLARRSRHFS